MRMGSQSLQVVQAHHPEGLQAVDVVTTTSRNLPKAAGKPAAFVVLGNSPGNPRFIHQKDTTMLASTIIDAEPLERSEALTHAVAAAFGVTARAEADPARPQPEVDQWSKARCRDGNGTLTHLFFSEDELLIARAKAICSRCSVADLCLATALERQEPWGVWGGQLIVDGVVVAIKRRRGRPPKHPRPVLVVDEVPVPPMRSAGAAERVA